ncbi:hypothetical protein HHK36_004544 [Tetracentron sinense]|uniref:YTH domain-containing family protein n=1 Tax=Tetracentron sinense TaxID=13715 RepID=A0A834ZV44_TETSI|nr:hypothetical protein HHK36_004544 [Tetracentron sinense]
MAGEKKIEKPREVVVTGLKSVPFAKLPEQNVASGKVGSPSDSTASIPSSGAATSSIKGETGQESVAEQDFQYPPTTCYGYYYAGYDGAYPEGDDRGYFHEGEGSEMPYSGMQSDNGSLVYYVPGYNPYATGTLLGVDGQHQQPYFSSSGYLQPPVSSFGSETVPPYSWDSTQVGDAPNRTTAVSSGSKPNASAPGPYASVKSKGLNSMKTNGAVDSKVSALPLDTRSCSSTASSNFSKAPFHSHPVKTINKNSALCSVNVLFQAPQFGSVTQSAGLVKGCQPMRRFSSFSNQGQGLFPHNGPMNYRTNGRIGQGGDRFRLGENFNRNGEFEASSELNRGPRARNGSTHLRSSTEKDQLGLTVRRDQYNLQDFQTGYKNAKFFVIKSYSEDDIHKCIKYDVWASTSKGNMKLNAAFHDAEKKSSETGTSCPIFLFFSVNASGQFVGLAEMIGQVDFKKDMDFWQLEKWNGFFPVKWHIIKDIPNGHLRHIILENNDNKPVTNSKDTQEIGYKQGLQMLAIFKSYLVKTSMLDDFNFYEDREKSLHARRSSKPASPQMEIYTNNDFPKHFERVRKVEETSTRAKNTFDSKTSLITLTKNLTLNSRPQENVAGKDSN